MIKQRSTNEPLFIDCVQQYYEKLDIKYSAEVALVLTVDAIGSYRYLRFRVPNGEYAKMHDHIIFERYMLARINNMLVTFGGTQLKIYYDQTDKTIESAIKKAINRYDVGNLKNIRQGLGCILNYISRINVLLGTGQFCVEYLDINDFVLPKGRKEFQIFNGIDSNKGEELLVRAANELNDKVFCGLDIGGNSIKVAAIAEGEIILLKTYSWFPTFFTTAEELIDPIILLIRFMSAVLRYFKQNNVRTLANYDDIMQSTADYEKILAYTQKLENSTAGNAPVFDGIIIGFPDIVVNDKIAGGESYKQRGMRNNTDRNYEDEFKKQSDLNILAQQYIKDDGIVKVLNDGNVSSFVFSVEQAFADENIIDENGMLAYTIGTEMGTGFISRIGSIQWIPLECYNYIIDLGNDDFYQFDPNDVRSVKNFNTCATGTVQKYISQIGLIRIAIKNIKENDIKLYEQLLNEYLSYDNKNDVLTIANKPIDMRSPLTRKLIELLKDGNSELIKTFEQIGHCLGVVIKEVDLILNELGSAKLLSGGIVMADECFYSIKKGLSKKYSEYEVKRLDTSIIHSPLLKKLNKDDGNYATAVGAAYLANRELLIKKNKEQGGSNA